MPVRTARTAAIATLSLGGLVALAAWSALIVDLLAWEAPRVAVVPPIAGAVLPRVEIVRPPSGAVPPPKSPARAAEHAAGAGVSPGAAAASGAPAVSEAPAADRRLRELMDALRARLDAQREL
ncbi:MAG: hypothetical protein FGM37_04865, partial [Phycisphaerales bacterium]|nr:hypothetical protein [Phycisphaerales bacterium]